MGERMNAWLHHQQCRFMRPDSARYLRPDHRRYGLPERKWDGQPRIDKDESGGGRFTFGLQYGGTFYDGDRPRVELLSNSSSGNDDQDDDEQDDGANQDIWLASAEGPGIGHNSEGEPEAAPDIPESMPKTSEDRMAFVRAAASWLFGRSAIVVSAYFGLLDQVDEIARLSHMIRSANDPPSSLSKLQSRAQGPGEPGYENHHIVNQHLYNRNKFGDARIEAPANVVRIPKLKHIELSRWYAKANPQYGGRSPQQALRDMSWEEQTSIGIERLRYFKVLE
jgi:hypothetical protein